MRLRSLISWTPGVSFYYSFLNPVSYSLKLALDALLGCWSLNWLRRTLMAVSPECRGGDVWMIAGGGKGDAFGGWCFSKARRRNLAHIAELHLPPPSFPQHGGDDWRAPGLLPQRCGAEAPLLMVALPQADTFGSHTAFLWSTGKQSRPGCLGPDAPGGQCSAISLQQLVLKKSCQFCKDAKLWMGLGCGFIYSK